MIAKDLSSKELAEIVRTINATGICPSRFERECLSETADRLEKLYKLEKMVEEYDNDRQRLNPVR